MAWTPYQIVIAVVMVVTGSINTLATKWADKSKSVGIDGTKREFNHPFLQAVGMFLGELSCLGAYYIIRSYYTRRDSPHPPAVAGSRKFNPLIFLPPALCDLTATSLMYIALNLTYASVFQMLRGAIIIFTGIGSVIFLKRRLKCYEWLGMVVVTIGLVIVGLSHFIIKSDDDKKDEKDTTSMIIGDVLIVVGQVLAAGQFILEEKFVAQSNVSPLQAVGWEGFFGFLILSLALIPMYYIPTGSSKKIFTNPNGQMEDALDGFVQIGNCWTVAVGLCGTVISIAFFNFAGISVTKEISATTRTVLDSVRTLIIWGFSLIVKWETFTYIQAIGFVVLIIGMFLYNDVLIRPSLIQCGVLKPDPKTVSRSDVSAEK